MFVAVRRIGHVKQFHARLFRRAIGFAMIARAARGNDIDPIVAAVFGNGYDMIFRQFTLAIFAAAIGADMAIAGE